MTSCFRFWTMCSWQQCLLLTCRENFTGLFFLMYVIIRETTTEALSRTIFVFGLAVYETDLYRMCLSNLNPTQWKIFMEGMTVFITLCVLQEYSFFTHWVRSNLYRFDNATWCAACSSTFERCDGKSVTLSSVSSWC